MKSVFVLTLFVLGGFCGVRAQVVTLNPQTDNATNALRASPEFHALEADRQKLAERFYADAERQAKSPAFLVNPVKFALLAADTAGSEEPYRKFYAKRFSELIEEYGGQTGTQVFIDIRTKIASEWQQQNSK